MRQPSETRDRNARDIRWSPRQRETLDLLAKGRTNSEIADDLGISLDGAKYHVSEIITKLDVDTREEAAEWWRQQKGLRARLRVLTRTGWAPAVTPAVLRWAGAGVASIAGIGVLAIAAYAVVPTDDGDGQSSPAEQTPTTSAATESPKPACIDVVLESLERASEPGYEFSDLAEPFGHPECVKTGEGLPGDHHPSDRD